LEGCKGLYIDLYAEHEKLYQSGIKLRKIYCIEGIGIKIQGN
jgi:hypothetical protein